MHAKPIITIPTLDTEENERFLISAILELFAAFSFKKQVRLKKENNKIQGTDAICIIYSNPSLLCSPALPYSTKSLFKIAF